MPLRLDAMMSDQSADVLSKLLDQALHHAEDAFATEDGRYVLLSKDILDEKTNAPVGHCIVTMARDTARKTLNILDMDIVLDSDAPVELQFVTRYEGSSDANEYARQIFGGTDGKRIATVAAGLLAGGGTVGPRSRRQRRYGKRG